MTVFRFAVTENRKNRKICRGVRDAALTFDPFCTLQLRNAGGTGAVDRLKVTGSTPSDYQKRLASPGDDTRRRATR